MSRLQHVGITRSDLRKSEKFYIEHFGLENVHEMDVAAETINKIFGINSSAKLVFLKGENTIVELFDFPEVKTKPSMGSITHLALSVGNPKEIFEKMKVKGIETTLINKGNNQFAYFVKDPDGVLVELKE